MEQITTKEDADIWYREQLQELNEITYLLVHEKPEQALRKDNYFKNKQGEFLDAKFIDANIWLQLSQLRNLHQRAYLALGAEPENKEFYMTIETFLGRFEAIGLEYLLKFLQEEL